ncbi:MAG: hypothetical protein P8X74_09800 [Reinekea sp.]
MNSYTSLQIGSLFLAIPGHEVAQISLSRDIQIESRIPYVTFQNQLIPVISIDERFSTLRYGTPDIGAKYIVTLGFIDHTLRFQPRLALQVESTFKSSIMVSGLVPQTMKKTKSPITGWFEDHLHNRGFLTHTAALEAFVNHATKVFSNENHSSLAG